MDTDFTKGGYYFEAYNQAYALHKKYHVITEDSQWSDFVNDLKAITNPFAMELCALIGVELERGYKEYKG